MPQEVKRCVLAYSGGLDTSCILAWLIEEGWEVICYMANVGQEEDWDAAREKALKVGAKKVYVEDLREEFINDTVIPAAQANAIYENVYLLGTSLARPIIARRQIQIAEKENCIAVSHGCTGKGNDQVRFELAYYALKPDVQVIAPWRLPVFFERFAGRKDLLEYAAAKGIPVTQTTKKPWSMDENIVHCSYEAGILEDPSMTPPKDMWKLTVDPKDAPDEVEELSIHFEKGAPTKLECKDGTFSGVVSIFYQLNAIARRNGVGRIDIVENRFSGLKSRGCYETPGLTILRTAHMDLEGLTMEREVRALRDQFVTFNLAKILYNGQFFSPCTRMLLAANNVSQEVVNGVVKLSVYKGNVTVLGRKSDTAHLYDEKLSSMDELGGFDPTWTSGFIQIESMRLRNSDEGKHWM
ncbi:Argininosuccinate synthase [Schizosaccharomyces pombe]|uniref:Argininosuccinate synthase n=1 Tax=Schizosaccharomyces pombe (strain 972 / ATCC 24843) TaxID=284812 RepID=ASSY_SCHPO|nr:putative argininosuccinate synthase [Schizosaccharomyces pombe]O94354.1 RecName: Full=Argininosuccinate synthase; AltName: Full=Citrulline--aspartate ligase [Schizosaccharomyces pombe 972h-]CAA22280.1 argininosuccinate synthase (predicted) [Schizosaccharomyces pombe]|eukprot:NP_595183.1 putative argininosuccinate synthase [Schizosaccharomyces pombe]